MRRAALPGDPMTIGEPTRTFRKVFSLPPLLVSLIQEGRWRQPSDEVIRAVIPVLPCSVDFYLTEAAILSAAFGQRSLGSDRSLKLFRLARSLPGSPSPDLPWIDTAYCAKTLTSEIHSEIESLMTR
jgi:hypothetical protein